MRAVDLLGTGFNGHRARAIGADRLRGVERQIEQRLTDLVRVRRDRRQAVDAQFEMHHLWNRRPQQTFAFTNQAREVERLHLSMRFAGVGKQLPGEFGGAFTRFDDRRGHLAVFRNAEHLLQ